jgi:DNA-binding response OmpR family regulator
MPRVLIIEDDPDMRELERTALECGGYDVRVASNGQEGLKEVLEESPCVVLLDLMMPVMDGLTFLRELAKHTGTAEIPVVCVSAAGPEITAHALRLGAREVFHKPTDLDVLCDRVNHYCQRQDV